MAGTLVRGDPPDRARPGPGGCCRWRIAGRLGIGTSSSWCSGGIVAPERFVAGRSHRAGRDDPGRGGQGCNLFELSGGFCSRYLAGSSIVCSSVVFSRSTLTCSDVIRRSEPAFNSNRTRQIIRQVTGQGRSPDISAVTGNLSRRGRGPATPRTGPCSPTGAPPPETPRCPPERSRRISSGGPPGLLCNDNNSRQNPSAYAAISRSVRDPIVVTVAGL